MSTLFTKIIEGEIPGRFVYQDEDCVAFLTIAPLADGHALVVPRAEVDKWTEAGPALMAHLTEVAQRIGKVQTEVFDAERAGLIIAGFEVPHLHIHVWPVHGLEEFSFDKVDNNPDQARLDENAERLREGLRAAGFADNVPGPGPL